MALITHKSEKIFSHFPNNIMVPGKSINLKFSPGIFLGFFPHDPKKGLKRIKLKNANENQKKSFIPPNANLENEPKRQRSITSTLSSNQSLKSFLSLNCNKKYSNNCKPFRILSNVFKKMTLSSKYKDNKPYEFSDRLHNDPNI